MNKQDLINFEEEIKELFIEKRIHGPVHLSRGNESQLIRIFKEVKPDDWCLSNHRSHYHALLKGVPAELIKNEIMANRSMHLNFKQYNFLTSSIVGGVVSIAVGIAMGLKRKNENRRVWCFIGDMAAHMGLAYESVKYAKGHNLPVCFVIEDDGFSSNTPTREVWGIEGISPEGVVDWWEQGRVISYSYQRQCEHVGVGTWVTF